MNAQIEKSEIALGQPPTVSVIIPIFNAGRFLEDAVESVAREKYGGAKEILLVEDGSSDDSLAVARKLKTKHEDLIRLYRHPDGENRGAGASRNLGIRNTTGDFICFLDADDYWLPGMLEESTKLLYTDLSIDGVYSPSVIRFENDLERKKSKSFSGILGTQRKIPPESMFEELLSGTNVSHINGYLLRRSSIFKIGFFNENLKRAQDMEFLLRAAAVLKLTGTPSHQPLSVIRRHGKNRWDPDTESEGDIVEYACMATESLLRWTMKNNAVTPLRRFLILKKLVRYYGMLGRINDIVRVSKDFERPSLLFHAWPFKIPGPRTIRLLTKNIFSQFSMRDLWNNK